MQIEIWKRGFRALGRYLKHHTPQILIATGCSGIIATVFLTIDATTKLHEDPLYDPDIQSKDDLFLQTKVVSKHFWRVGLSAVGTAGCFFALNKTHETREAALGLMYNMAQNKLSDIRKETDGIVTRTQEDKIESGAAQREIQRDPPIYANIIDTGDGFTLFRDPWNGRYFRTDKNKVEQAKIWVNDQLSKGEEVLMNDFFYQISPKIEDTNAGKILGWRNDIDSLRAYMEVRYVPVIYDQDTAETCTLINFSVQPVWNFDCIE